MTNYTSSTPFTINVDAQRGAGQGGINSALRAAKMEGRHVYVAAPYLLRGALDPDGDGEVQVYSTEGANLGYLGYLDPAYLTPVNSETTKAERLAALEAQVEALRAEIAEEEREVAAEAQRLYDISRESVGLGARHLNSYEVGDLVRDGFRALALDSLSRRA